MFPDYKKKFSKPMPTHLNAVIMVKHVHEHIDMSTHFSKRLILYVYCFSSHAGGIYTVLLCKTHVVQFTFNADKVITIYYVLYNMNYRGNINLDVFLYLDK